MNYEWTTKNGRKLEIDLTKWSILESIRHCKIIDKCDGNLLLENKYKDRFTFPEYLIKANEIIVIDNTIELSKTLYEHYFLKNFMKETMRTFDKLFEEYATLIFQNRNVVLNKAEYYLLRPRKLSTGFMYFGSLRFSLGNLFESFESGNHIYYDEFCGYRKMYLVSMSASPLSGTIFNATFWSDETNEFVTFPNQMPDSKEKLPPNFGTNIGRSLIEMLSSDDIIIDRQDRAIKELIKEINVTNS